MYVYIYILIIFAVAKLVGHLVAKPGIKDTPLRKSLPIMNTGSLWSLFRSPGFVTPFI